MKFALITAAALLAAVAPAADAAINIYVSNTSTGVFIETLGTLDLSGLTSLGAAGGSASSVKGNAFIFTGPSYVPTTAYAGFSGNATFGADNNLWSFATSGAGDAFGLNVIAGRVYVPVGYVSGAAINSSSTYDFKSIFALDTTSLDLTVGTYVYTSAHDTITLHIGEAAPAASVPEPASWAMMVGGFGLVGGALRSRRKAAVTFA